MFGSVIRQNEPLGSQFLRVAANIIGESCYALANAHNTEEQTIMERLTTEVEPDLTLIAWSSLMTV